MVNIERGHRPLKLFPLCLLFAATLPACRDDASFRGATDDSYASSDLAYNLPDDFSVRFGDVLNECHDSVIQPASGNKMARLVMPRACSFTVPDPDPRLRALDLVFVLDVTGSMRNELNAVREGMTELMAIAHTTGWDLQVGAVAFADDILAKYPLTRDVAATIAAMGQDNPIWAAPDGFGGDEPEIGLGAIEQGIEILRGGSGYERLLVYVSDAPARRVDKGNYDIAATAAVIQGFLRETADSDSAFHIFFSATDSRERLFDGMPTPADQLVDLIKRSGVQSTRLPFPLRTRSIRNDFLQPLQYVRYTNDLCEFYAAELHPSQGEVIPIPVGTSEDLFVADLSDRTLNRSDTLILHGNCRIQGEKIITLSFEF